MSYSEFPNTNYYDSDLKELIALYKKLLAEYDTLVSGFEELKNSVDNLFLYVDDEIAKSLDKTISEVNARMNSIEEEIQVQQERISSLTEEINTRFIAEREYTNVNIAAAKMDMLGKLSELAIDIGNEIADIRKELSEIEVTMGKINNPTTAEEDTIENTINDVWEANRVHSLTAARYDSLCFTAEEYDNKRITANDYAISAELILIPMKVFNPYTGEIDSLQNAINTSSIIGQTNPITAQEYLDLHITSDEYEAFDITAQQYDFNAKSYLITT